MTGAVGQIVGTELLREMDGVNEGKVEFNETLGVIEAKVELSESVGVLAEATVKPVPGGAVELANGGKGIVELANGGSVLIGGTDVVSLLGTAGMLNEGTRVLLDLGVDRGLRVRRSSEFVKGGPVVELRLGVGDPLG